MKEWIRHKQFIVLTGNYGSGKTEIALQLAYDFRAQGETTLVDLDIVNPYFRSAEKRTELEEAGIRVLMPVFAMTTVDIPALPAEIQSVFDVPAQRVVFDVGGDDTGAAALGRYYPSFSARREETLTAMVINCMRPLTGTVEDVCDLAERIRSRSRMELDLLINNANLADQTTPDMAEKGEELVLACAEKLGVPKVLTTGTEDVLSRCALRTPRLLITRRMKPEWMEEI